MSEFGPRPRDENDLAARKDFSAESPRRPSNKSGFLKKLALWASVLSTIGVAGERLTQNAPAESKEIIKPNTQEIKPNESQTATRNFEEFLHLSEDKEYLQDALRELKDLQKALENQNLMQEYAPDSPEREKFNSLVEKELGRLKKQLNNSPFWYDRLFKYIGARLPVLVEKGLEADVPLGVVLGVALEESSVNQQTKSPSGKAVGIMQLEKPTAREWQKIRLAEDFVDEEGLPKDKDLRQDAFHNIGIGVAGLHNLHESFGRWDLTTSAYNRGRTAIHILLDRLAKDHPGRKATYLDLLPYFPEKKKGKINPHKGYPVRVEAKLRLFQEYYLPKLITNIEKQLED